MVGHSAIGSKEPVVPEPPQGDHHPYPGEQPDFCLKKGVAIGELARGRLVAGWRTPSGRGDVAVEQLESISAADRGRLIREAVAMKRLIQPVAGRVPGKRSSGPIAAMSGRGETDHE